MQQLGFASQFISMIRLPITTATYFISINGNSIVLIRPGCGLR